MTATVPMTAEQIGTAVVNELRTIIEHDINNDPRTLQTALGPSEVGCACDRCLIHMLAGNKGREIGTPWLPALGRAVHESYELAVTRHMLHQLDTGVCDVGDHWITEGRVNVGDVNGAAIWGNSDVFHVPSGTVVDYKIVGTTTLKKIRADLSGVSLTYKRQAHMYGRGWQRAGYTVRAVAVWFVPRNGFTLSQGRVWSAAYDEQVAVAALDRATRFKQWINAFGVEQVLAAAGPHTDDEFSCKKYPDYQPVTRPAGPVTSLDLTT